MFQTFSKLPVPVCSLNENFIILSYNQNWETLLGSQDFTNKSILNFLSNQEDKEKIAQQLHTCLREGKSLLIDFELSNSQKQYLPLSWAVVCDEEKHELILCAQSSSEKEAIETRFARMYHVTTDAVMLLDGETFTDCNKATLDMFAVESVEKFITFHPADLSPEYQPDGEDSFTKANRMIMKAFQEGRNIFEWTHKKTTGEDFPAEVLLSPIVLRGKTYVQASVRDISERVKIQKELDEARLQQLNASRLASLGEMAGGIAHEINNPMAVIRSQAELIVNAMARSQEVPESFIKQGMERIISTSDRISRIIKGLKLLSRDSTSDPLLPTDLHIIIQDTLGFCEEKLKEKKITFEFISNESFEVICRSVEISQVILNLITNSIDAIEGLESPWIKLDITKDSTMGIIKVVDSGNGIPKSVAEKMTLPFFTTKEVGKGSGLGLSISKRIIERHQGDFYLDMKATNTTFVIRLPLSQVEI